MDTWSTHQLSCKQSSQFSSSCSRHMYPRLPTVCEFMAQGQPLTCLLQGT